MRHPLFQTISDFLAGSRGLPDASTYSTQMPFVEARDKVIVSLGKSTPASLYSLHPLLSQHTRVPLILTAAPALSCHRTPLAPPHQSGFPLVAYKKYKRISTRQKEDKGSFKFTAAFVYWDGQVKGRGPNLFRKRINELKGTSTEHGSLSLNHKHK